MPNSSTFTPNFFAARKCPNSCRIIKMPIDRRATAKVILLQFLFFCAQRDLLFFYCIHQESSAIHPSPETYRPPESRPSSFGFEFPPTRPLGFLSEHFCQLQAIFLREFWQVHPQRGALHYRTRPQGGNLKGLFDWLYIRFVPWLNKDLPPVGTRNPGKLL